ncbi:MAG: bifunctional precorrin-2 dehydrogenase/sirohydrochlorin ferrochelatase [Syntrophobacteraceae bacterium]
MQENHKRHKRSQYYPMFVSLDGQVCLVVGGGDVAERKIRTLLGCGALVRIVALKLTEWLEVQCREKRVTLIARAYEEACMDGADIVFAATNNAELNRSVSEAARKRKLWCNMASDPELGTFIVPSTYHQWPLTIAVSTAGASPLVTRLIREKLEQQFGREWIIFIKLMETLRDVIREKRSESSESDRLFRKIAALPIPEWIGSQEYQRTIEAIHEICQPIISMEEMNRLWDEAWK